MPTRRIRLLIFVGFLLAGAFGFAAGMRVGTDRLQTQLANQHAIQKTVTIRIQDSSRRELVDELQAFADKGGYLSRIVRVSPGDEYYDVEMWQPHIQILGTYEAPTGTLRLWFSNADAMVPTEAKAFEDEVGRLKTLIASVPGAAFDVK